MKKESTSRIHTVKGRIESGYSDYRLLSLHGHYQLGTVSRFGRLWFVKSLLPDYNNSSEGRMRLIKEYEILLSLKHEGIVRAVGLEEIPGVGLSLIMEYVNGEHLDDYLSKATRKGRREVAARMVEAVAYIHKEGLVHLDLKPENILVRGTADSPRLCLIDFNLSDGEVFTFDKGAGGNDRYAAPEQWEDGYEPVPGADVYSLGKLIAEINPGGAWRLVSRKALIKNVDKRPSDASELLRLERKFRKRIRLGVIGVTTLVVVSLIGWAVVTGLNSGKESAPAMVTARTVVSDSIPGSIDGNEPVAEVPAAVAPAQLPSLAGEDQKYERLREQSLQKALGIISASRSNMLALAADTTHSKSERTSTLVRDYHACYERVVNLMINTRRSIPENVRGNHSQEWCSAAEPEIVSALNELSKIPNQVK